MNIYNNQLIKIVFDVIKFIDDQAALQQIYIACGRKYAEISSKTTEFVK